jgi:hypothetical protein
MIARISAGDSVIYRNRAVIALELTEKFKPNRAFGCVWRDKDPEP